MGEWRPRSPRVTRPRKKLTAMRRTWRFRSTRGAAHPDGREETLAGRGRAALQPAAIPAIRVLNSLLGDSALVRFDRDVLGLTGVKYVILLEGINDIGLGHPDVTADQVIAGYQELIDRAHTRGLIIFGGSPSARRGIRGAPSCPTRSPWRPS